jgi:hypothetical protein
MSCESCNMYEDQLAALHLFLKDTQFMCDLYKKQLQILWEIGADNITQAQLENARLCKLGEDE